jgi:hypothetical protein
MTEEILLTDEALLDRVRERASQQRIPCEVPRSIVVTRGEALVCAVCDGRIAGEEPVYEIEFDPERSAHRMNLHRRCYLVWDAECLSRRAVSSCP